MKLSQVQVLAKELAKRPLTGKQIENELGIMNYKGRISDLRLKMWLETSSTTLNPIVATEMVKKETRWGKSRIARYYILPHCMREYKKFLKQFLTSK